VPQPRHDGDGEDDEELVELRAEAVRLADRAEVDVVVAEDVQRDSDE
jgi:hypothetical protein